MNGATADTKWLRSAMLAVAVLAAAGTAVELALIGHWDSPIMVVPWLVLGGGAVAARTVATAHRRAPLRVVRAFALVAGIAAWWGVVEHLTTNARFVQELHPAWSRLAVLWAAVRGGVPGLAPLAVALPALLAAAATLGHPAFHPGGSDPDGLDASGPQTNDGSPARGLASSPARSAEPSSTLRSNRVGPIVRFMLAGLVALAVVLALTTFASTRIAQREAVEDAKDTSAVYLRTVIEPQLGAGLATGEAGAVASLDAAVRTRLLSDRLVRVKVWSREGVILYADASELIGERYELADEDLAALGSRAVEAEITSATRPENRFEAPLGTLLEVYSGASLDSGEPVLVEIYHSYDTVTAKSQRMFRTLLPVAFGSLVILQLLQFPLARSLALQVRRHAAERSELHRRSTEAAESERRRIAADLHDGSIQNLTGLALSLDAEGRSAHVANSPYATRLQDAAKNIRREMRALRTLVTDLNPPLLAGAGLRTALEALAAPLRGAGTSVAIDVPVDLADDGAGRAMVYRVVEEALRNASNHANASQVSISVRSDRVSMDVEVADDGSGIAPGALEARRAEGHLGLELLAHTVKDSGGELTVSSTEGAGTTVVAQIPIVWNAAADGRAGTGEGPRRTTIGV